MIEDATPDTSESLRYVEQLAQLKASVAIPTLEKKFERTTDIADRAHIASALVRLGDKDDKFWNFLVQVSRPAIDTDAPVVVRSDSQPGASPAFVAWAEAHTLTTDSALQTMYQQFTQFVFLAQTGDPRGIPILRRALFAPYFLTQSYAAEGLAAIQDKDSIPFILKAIEQSNPDSRPVIAKSLIYFDDPRARAGFDAYVPQDLAKALRESVANGKRPFH